MKNQDKGKLFEVMQWTNKKQCCLDQHTCLGILQGDAEERKSILKRASPRLPGDTQIHSWSITAAPKSAAPSGLTTPAVELHGVGGRKQSYLLIPLIFSTICIHWNILCQDCAFKNCVPSFWNPIKSYWLIWNSNPSFNHFNSITNSSQDCESYYHKMHLYAVYVCVCVYLTKSVWVGNKFIEKNIPHRRVVVYK